LPEQDSRTIQQVSKITFPFNSDFQIIENGKTIEVLHTDPWFESAISWSKEWTNLGNSLPTNQAEKDKLIAEVLEKIGYPTIYQNH
jgi:hypothetical protein